MGRVDVAAKVERGIGRLTGQRKLIQIPKMQDMRGDKALRSLYLATSLYMIVVMVRPQDILPPLGAIRPGLLSVLLLFYALVTARALPTLKDPIVKVLIAYAVVLLAGIAVVVNHFHWFWTLFEVLSYISAFVIAMPILLASEKYRHKFLFLILFSFGLAAVYGITHEGKGQGDWLGDENDMACALNLGFAISASYGFCRGKRPFKVLAIGVSLLCVFGIFAAESRGGYLGFGAALLGFAIFSGQFFRSLIMVAVLGVAAYPLVPEETKLDLASIGNSQDGTRMERIYSWKAGWEMYLSSPLIGVGASNYPWRIAEFQKEEDKSGRHQRPLAGRVAHSSYVTALAESGTLGIALYLSVIVMVLRRAARCAKGSETASGESRAMLATATGVGLLGAGVSAAFITFTYAPPLYLLAGLAVSMDVGRNHQNQRS